MIHYLETILLKLVLYIDLLELVKQCQNIGYIAKI